MSNEMKKEDHKRLVFTFKLMFRRIPAPAKKSSKIPNLKRHSKGVPGGLLTSEVEQEG